MEDLSVLEQLDINDNLEKYKKAGVIVSKALNKVLEFIKPNINTKILCDVGDKCLLNELEKAYNKKKLKNGKGLSFPTCISINNTVGYDIPDDETTLIKEGDIIKIDMGVHIDGFPALVCYSTLVNEENNLIDDKRANVIMATSEASKEVLKLIKPDNNNIQVVKKMEEIATKYNCSLLTCDGKFERSPGVFSYQISQNTIDGKNDEDGDDLHKMILNRWNESFDYELAPTEFEENEVYAIDIAMSTGKGRIKLSDKQTKIFRRDHDKYYGLKLKASKQVLSHFRDNFFPTNIKDKMNPRFKMGVNECLKNNLLVDYPVMEEKDNEYVSRVKFTVIVRRKKQKKIKVVIY